MAAIGAKAAGTLALLLLLGAGSSAQDHAAGHAEKAPANAFTESEAAEYAAKLVALGYSGAKLDALLLKLLNSPPEARTRLLKELSGKRKDGGKPTIEGKDDALGEETARVQAPPILPGAAPQDPLPMSPPPGPAPATTARITREVGQQGTASIGSALRGAETLKRTLNSEAAGDGLADPGREAGAATAPAPRSELRDAPASSPARSIPTTPSGIVASKPAGLFTGALGRFPDMFSRISVPRLTELKQEYLGRPSQPSLRDLQLKDQEDDFKWSRSCVKLSGTCNPHASAPSYRKGAYVSPEDLDALWRSLRRGGGVVAAKPGPAVVEQPKKGPSVPIRERSAQLPDALKRLLAGASERIHAFLTGIRSEEPLILAGGGLHSAWPAAGGGAPSQLEFSRPDRRVTALPPSPRPAREEHRDRSYFALLSFAIALMLVPVYRARRNRPQ